jgi:integrase
LYAGLAPLLETALAEPGIAARGRGYAVTREDPTDRDRADLGWSADPSDPDRLLFVTARGYPIRHNQFYKRIFAPVVASALPARLAGFRWHDLRHTCAALSLAEGGSLHHVKERLGHENIATTVDLYGKRVPSVDAALADAVGASIFEPGADNVVPLHAQEQ